MDKSNAPAVRIIQPIRHPQNPCQGAYQIPFTLFQCFEMIMAPERQGTAVIAGDGSDNEAIFVSTLEYGRIKDNFQSSFMMGAAALRMNADIMQQRRA